MRKRFISMFLALALYLSAAGSAWASGEAELEKSLGAEVAEAIEADPPVEEADPAAREAEKSEPATEEAPLVIAGMYASDGVGQSSPAEAAMYLRDGGDPLRAAELLRELVRSEWGTEPVPTPTPAPIPTPTPTPEPAERVEYEPLLTREDRDGITEYEITVGIGLEVPDIIAAWTNEDGAYDGDETDLEAGGRAVLAWAQKLRDAGLIEGCAYCEEGFSVSFFRWDGSTDVYSPAIRDTYSGDSSYMTAYASFFKGADEGPAESAIKGEAAKDAARYIEGELEEYGSVCVGTDVPSVIDFFQSLTSDVRAIFWCGHGNVYEDRAGRVVPFLILNEDVTEAKDNQYGYLLRNDLVRTGSVKDQNGKVYGPFYAITTDFFRYVMPVTDGGLFFSTACKSLGTEALEKVLFEKGFEAYIAPRGSVERIYSNELMRKTAQYLCETDENGTLPISEALRRAEEDAGHLCGNGVREELTSRDGSEEFRLLKRTRVEITITDRYGEYIVDASVTLSDGERSYEAVLTDDEETPVYAVTAAPDASYTLTVRADGYDTFTEEIETPHLSPDRRTVVLTAPGSVEITVTDAETGEALSGVGIMLGRGDHILSGATDTAGELVIRDVYRGGYTLTASKRGYKGYETPLEVGGDRVRLSFGLEMTAESVVTFDPNGGNSDVKTVTVRTGKAIGELPSASRRAAVFLGWNTCADGSGEYLTPDHVILGDSTWYACWEKTTCVEGTVLDAESGVPVSGASVRLSGTNGEEITVVSVEDGGFFADLGITTFMTEWKLEVSGQGYEDHSETLLLVAGQIRDLGRLELVPESVSVIWDRIVAESYDGGSGTKDDPYQIANGRQLALLAQEVNAGVTYEGRYFVLTEDIYLNDVSVREDRTFLSSFVLKDRCVGMYEDLRIWTPIGFEKGTIFSGTLDGAGYSVYGTYVSGESEDQCCGLFGTVDGTIQNLNVSCTDIRGAGRLGAGGIVGQLSYGGTITGCSHDGMVSGSDGIGGVAGVVFGGVISGCSSTGYNGYISGDSRSGGIVGVMYDGAQVTNCTFDSYLRSYDGESWIGGIVGEVDDSLVTGCVNTGTMILDWKRNTTVGTIIGGQGTPYTANYTAYGNRASSAVVCNTKAEAFSGVPMVGYNEMYPA